MVGHLGRTRVRVRSRSSRHPDERVTAAYLDGTLDPDAMERIERHLAQCPECRAGMVALKSVSMGETVPPEWVALAKDLKGSRAGLPSRRVATVAAAAALVLCALALGLQIGRRSQPPADRYRAAPSDGFEALAPAPCAIVEGASVVFRWSPHPDADRYVLTVLDADGAAVATLEARPPESSATWSPSPAPRSPTTLLWKVRALRGNRTVAETRPVAFETR